MLSSDQRIAPNPWFDDRAEGAARYHVPIFVVSEVKAVSRYGAGAPRPAGSVSTVKLILEGRSFVAPDGGLEAASVVAAGPVGGT